MDQAERRSGLNVAGRPVDGRLWLAAAVAVVTSLTILGLCLWRTGMRPESLAALGYPGIALVMMISGASLFLSGPAQATVLGAGALWNPILVGLAAGLGNATGELVGYAAGRAGAKGAAALTDRTPPRWWGVLKGWLARYGFFAILVLAMVPNPVFDAVGILAGSLGYPMQRFWLAAAIGNTIKYIGVAYLGGAASFWLGWAAV